MIGDNICIQIVNCWFSNNLSLNRQYFFCVDDQILKWTSYFCIAISYCYKITGLQKQKIRMYLWRNILSKIINILQSRYNILYGYSVGRYQLVSQVPNSTQNIYPSRLGKWCLRRPSWEFWWQGRCQGYAICGHVDLHYSLWYYWARSGGGALLIDCCVLWSCAFAR